MSALQSTKACFSWDTGSQGEKLFALTRELKPSNRVAACHIGEGLAEISGDNVIGWKIAATNTLCFCDHGCQCLRQVYHWSKA